MDFFKPSISIVFFLFSFLLSLLFNMSLSNSTNTEDDRLQLCISALNEAVSKFQSCANWGDYEDGQSTAKVPESVSAPVPSVPVSNSSTITVKSTSSDNSNIKNEVFDMIKNYSLNMETRIEKVLLDHEKSSAKEALEAVFSLLASNSLDIYQEIGKPSSENAKFVLYIKWSLNVETMAKFAYAIWKIDSTWSMTSWARDPKNAFQTYSTDVIGSMRNGKPVRGYGEDLYSILTTNIINKIKKIASKHPELVGANSGIDAKKLQSIIAYRSAIAKSLNDHFTSQKVQQMFFTYKQSFSYLSKHLSSNI